MSKKDQRIALMGWGAGAVVAIGAYVGALQFNPAAPSPPLVASLQVPAAGVDPILTGSIGGNSAQPMLEPSPSVQAKLDSMTLELAALRDALAASQAATVSTNRRLSDIEENLSLMTASVSRMPGEAIDQALPAAIEPLRLAETEPRVVLPTPVPTDGGSVAISMRPLTISMDGADDGTDEPAESGAPPTPSDAPVMSLSQTPFAIDLGGAATLEAIDALWLDRQERFGPTLGDLTPRILLQQTSEGALDLRLVAGPINDAADAAILCAQLVAAGLERCLPAIFDGQQLALR